VSAATTHNEDVQAAMLGVRALLRLAGKDPDSEAVLGTPDRVTRAMIEMTAGRLEDPKTILERRFDGGDYDQMVVLRGIQFVSTCEHHLLPFTGIAVVAYIPNKTVVGLSKLARLVECYAKRLQLQERMTQEIAAAILEHLEPRGVGVVVKATHSCMAVRGVRKNGAEMVTSCMLGAMKDKPEARAELMALL
jgi:GTP cyclohydrolase I